MKKLRNTLCFGLALLLLGSVFCGCGKQKQYNIFTEFAAVADDSILPRHAKFGQALEAVMQEKNLTDADITGIKDRYIVTDYPAEHIPYKIQEKLCFVSEAHEEIKNQLYRVEYIIEVQEADKEAAFTAFYEQAKAALPAPDAYLNSLESIKTGESVIWTDKEGNTLSFSSADGGNGLTVAILSMRSGAHQRSLET